MVRTTTRECTITFEPPKKSVFMYFGIGEEGICNVMLYIERNGQRKGVKIPCVVVPHISQLDVLLSSSERTMNGVPKGQVIGYPSVKPEPNILAIFYTLDTGFTTSLPVFDDVSPSSGTNF